jgi:hypothetical protein
MSHRLTPKLPACVGAPNSDDDEGVGEEERFGGGTCYVSHLDGEGVRKSVVRPQMEYSLLGKGECRSA